MNVHGLDHIVLMTPDIERSLAWYTGLLGLAPVRVEQWLAGQVPFPSVRIDDHTIVDLLEGERSGVNMNHLCLVVDRPDIDEIARDSRFHVVDGPGTRFGARGDGWSIYVTDPDGNVVEFRSYD